MHMQDQSALLQRFFQHAPIPDEGWRSRPRRDQAADFDKAQGSAGECGSDLLTNMNRHRTWETSVGEVKNACHNTGMPVGAIALLHSQLSNDVCATECSAPLWTQQNPHFW